ncbi:MAG: TIGR01777 family oxidoreductase [Ferruginibacter sp.]
METVLITGGSGLVGKALTKHLIEKGYKVIVLTRSIGRKATIQGGQSVEYAHWDIAKKTIDIKAVQSADYIVHLAGVGVMEKPWTDTFKKEIIASRAESARLIRRTLQKNSNKVKAVISASAIGWYGADSNPVKPFVETDPADKSFLGETCRLWEENVDRVQQLGKRLVKLRLGIILSNDGGAMIEFKKPLKLGVAGIIGNGKQIISWIHIEDVCRLFTAAIENEQLNGVYNAVAPTPVTNKELILEIAKDVKGKFFIPMHVPEFVLKTILGARSVEVLKSATVSCEKIKQTGFTFLYPTIEAAMKQLSSKN